MSKFVIHAALAISVVIAGVALTACRTGSSQIENIPTLLSRMTSPAASPVGGSAFAPLPGQSTVTQRAFIKFEGITGESTEAQHKDWIDVLALDWGSRQAGTTSAGIARKADFQPLTFVHLLDKASPKLFRAFATVQHIRKVTVHFVRMESGKPAFTFMEYDLEDVIVLSLKDEASPEATGDKLLEEVSLTYAKIALQYTPQKAGGGADQPVREGWDLRGGKGF